MSERIWNKATVDFVKCSCCGEPMIGIFSKELRDICYSCKNEGRQKKEKSDKIKA